MQRSNIQWTDYTANPIRYRNRETGATEWACVRVSQGCVNCYAEALARRYHRGGPFTVGNMAGLEPFVDERELWQMLRSRAISGRRVFVGDMTDVFGDWVTDEMLDRLFAVFALRPEVTWQVLTKRPARMRAYLTTERREKLVAAAISVLCDDLPEEVANRLLFEKILRGSPWPLLNVWLGTSIEDQRAADERIPHLLATPAAVRFLSCEPLLGPVELPLFYPARCDCEACSRTTRRCTASLPRLEGLDWVIIGGESGPGARPCNIEWARSLMWQCEAADVPVFVKQVGSRPVGLAVQHSHGGNPEEWPIDLRIREFPEVNRA